MKKHPNVYYVIWNRETMEYQDPLSGKWYHHFSHRFLSAHQHELKVKKNTYMIRAFKILETTFEEE